MKYLLAQLAIQDPGQFFATFTPEVGADTLTRLWEAIGEQLPAGERLPSDGLAVWHRPGGELPEITLLTLPSPAASNEAWFVAAVRAGEGCRVFSLERSATLPGGEESTILAELAADGRSNWGPGGNPVAEEFAELVCRLVADPSAQPISFVPMRLG